MFKFSIGSVIKTCARAGITSDVTSFSEKPFVAKNIFLDLNVKLLVSISTFSS
jgi:hypothetical protein